MGELRDTWDGLKADRSKEGMQTSLDARLADFIETLVDAVEAGASGGSSLTGAFKMQGDYDFTVTNEFPTADDCVDDLTVDDGIPKGYAWRVSEKYGDYSINDIIVAKVDNAINNSEQWDVLEGNIGNSPNLIATAYGVNGDDNGTTTFSFIPGKSLLTHFITHFVIKTVSGTTGGGGAGFKINIDGVALVEDVITGGAHGAKSFVFTVGRNDMGINFSNDPGSGINFEVTSTNGGSVEYDVFLYGLPY